MKKELCVKLVIYKDYFDIFIRWTATMHISVLNKTAPQLPEGTMADL
jgi:hypothetical protein